MFYNVLELKDLVECEEHKINRHVLLENGDSSLTAVSIKKDEMIGSHESQEDTCAYVYEGEADFHFEAEKFTVKKGELILFKKGDTHEVYAKKDTKFLLVKI
ncbi:MAG: cupin domain-containing protein [Candidatus Gastranaerophilales bacterium]|nr:cupin domain-containing protein [Candidatus Gastranaerophilales bacterium]